MSEKVQNNSGEKKDCKRIKKEDYINLKAEKEELEKNHKKLKEELVLAKEAAKESMEMVKNFKLDVDRIRERSEQLNSQLGEKLTIMLAQKLLPVLDNFENALAHMKEDGQKKGFKMIHASLLKALEEMDVKPIEDTTGVFDPNRMEAIMAQSTDNEQLIGTISNVITTGYYYVPTDKVVRYTQVAVYK